MPKHANSKSKGSAYSAGAKRRRKGTKKRQGVSKAEVLKVVRGQLETHMAAQEIDEATVQIGQSQTFGFFNALNRGDLAYQFNGKQVYALS
jgi:hypothetical protein